MKATLFTILKFNTLIAAIFLLLALLGGRSMDKSVAVLVLILLLFAVVANLKILWNGRRKMLASVESVVVEATAVAMSVGDKARARVEERAKERQP